MVSQTINVILLAAGRGVRLGELTNNIPKCLLPFNEDETILDVTLNTLVDNEFVGNICIIGGYAIDSLANHLAMVWRDEIECGKIVLLSNPLFETTNNMVSLVQAWEYLLSGGMVIEADIVCHPKIMLNVLESGINNPQRTILMIDESGKDRPDAVRISQYQNGNIKNIGKAIDLEVSVGEYIGIFYLSPEDAKSAQPIFLNQIKLGNKNLLYEEVLAIGSSNGKLPLYPISTAELPWTEIDTAEDYDKAKKIYRKIIK